MSQPKIRKDLHPCTVQYVEMSRCDYQIRVNKLEDSLGITFIVDQVIGHYRGQGIFVGSIGIWIDDSWWVAGRLANWLAYKNGKRNASYGPLNAWHHRAGDLIHVVWLTVLKDGLKFTIHSRHEKQDFRESVTLDIVLDEKQSRDFVVAYCDAVNYMPEES